MMRNNVELQNIVDDYKRILESKPEQEFRKTFAESFKPTSTMPVNTIMPMSERIEQTKKVISQNLGLQLYDSVFKYLKEEIKKETAETTVKNFMILFLWYLQIRKELMTMVNKDKNLFDWCVKLNEAILMESLCKPAPPKQSSGTKLSVPSKQPSGTKQLSTTKQSNKTKQPTSGRR